jgi:transcriptional regulator GlxA family with amidase domain
MWAGLLVVLLSIEPVAARAAMRFCQTSEAEMGDLDGPATMDARIDTAINAMRRSLATRQPIRVLSSLVNLSPSRLRELFKKETGRSPMQYLKEMRMERAEELLRSTFFSIKEIAFLSGLNVGSHFGRNFKKQYGLTPSEFRAKRTGTRDGRQAERGSGE